MSSLELRARIEIAVKRIEANIPGVRTTDTRRNRIVDKLEQLGDSRALWRVLDRYCDEERMPTPPQLVEAVHAEMQRARPNEQTEKLKPLSVQQRAAADEAAITSMLWLHLVKKKPASWFGGSIFARVLKREGKFTTADVQAFFDREIAQNGITPESIDAWMQDQIARGN